LLGADIARDLIPAKPDNIRGFWESAAVMAIHDDLLNAVGSEDPFDPISLRRGWQEAKQAQRAKYQLMDQVDLDFAGSSLFVVKDPRISRVLPLWMDVLQALGIDVIVVIPFRNPLEVAASLAQRDAVSLPKALLLNLQSYLDVEFTSRASRRVFVRYDSLLHDWRTFQTQLNELSDTRFSPLSNITRAKIDEYLTADLYHQRFSRVDLLSSTDVPMIMVELYGNMCKAVEMKDDLSVRSEFDRLRGSCEHAGRLYRGFITEERRALRRSANAERNAAKEEFERSTSWRVTAPLRWTKSIATSGFQSNPAAIFRKLMLRTGRDNGHPITTISDARGKLSISRFN
jgi:hypothetical protein